MRHHHGPHRLCHFRRPQIACLCRSLAATSTIRLFICRVFPSGFAFLVLAVYLPLEQNFALAATSDDCISAALRVGSNSDCISAALRAGSNSDCISAALRAGSNVPGQFRCAPSPRSQLSSRWLRGRSSAGGRALFADAQALANILLHLLSVRSAFAELICGGSSHSNAMVGDMLRPILPGALFVRQR